jgi:hypothetical protein
MQTGDESYVVEAGLLEARIKEELDAMALLTVMHADLRHYRRSELAAAAVLAVRTRLGIRPLWSARLTDLVGHASTDLADLSSLLLAKGGHLVDHDHDPDHDPDLSRALDSLTLTPKSKPMGGASPTSVNIDFSIRKV